ncbi:class I adenylate-forming enzyme family protein [candidate division CSSED10-310 bacterium]|uniref:Class I adenylate-forming enzyme family protein n=1 Tax=candidate division CSSED10-310 bacterium TaxID=2855610 RepID=A0ABV6YSR7_UNCC1
MNCGEWISKRAANYPDHLFLKDEELTLNNLEFNVRVNRMAHCLAKHGIVKGERVALLAENRTEFLEIFFGCAKLGAILVPLNFRLAVPELEYMIKDSEPVILIYTSDFFSQVEKIKKAELEIQYFLRIGNENSPDISVAEYSRGCSLEEPVPVENVINDDALAILYTSGTTGVPKGAILTHGNILFGAIHSLIGYGINKSYKSLVAAPLFHIAALVAGAIPVIYAGGSLILTREFNPLEIIELIVSEKVNYMFTVPVIYQLMTQVQEWDRADFSHVHFFIAGGAPLPIAVIRKYQQEKGVSFAQGYGMTETGRLSSLDLEDSIRKAGSVGKPVFHTKMRLIDDEGNDVVHGQVGEITVQGPNIFSRYWRNLAETEKAIQQGWFHTGDMGKCDQDGFLYIVGRKVEMIISAGENIYPAEVEKAIQAIPQVNEVAVIGKATPKKGEVIVAFVSLKKNETLTKREMVNALKGKIADFKIPREVYFITDFPRNAMGKIKKQELKQKFK